MISTNIIAISVLMAERGLNEDEAGDLHLAMMTMMSMNMVIEAQAALATGVDKRDIGFYYKPDSELEEDDTLRGADFEATLQNVFPSHNDLFKAIMDEANKLCDDPEDIEFQDCLSSHSDGSGSLLPFVSEVPEQELVVRRKPVPSYEESVKTPAGSSNCWLSRSRISSGKKEYRDPIMHSTFSRRPSSGQWLGQSKKKINGITRTASPRLEDFILRHYIGRGAQGSVYLATHIKNSQKLYAIKTFKKSLMDDVDTQRVVREQKILKRLNGSPFISELSASFHDTKFFYVVMPYYGGGDLQQLIFFHGPLDLYRTQFYASELIVALGHLESVGIYHRDLKPSNVLLSCDGHIILADFGVAGDCVKGSTSWAGTIIFMAPEVLTRKLSSTPSDIWSLGMILWTMNKGTPPFFVEDDDDELTQTQLGIINDALPAADDMDTGLHNLCEGILQKAPAQRLTYSQIKDHETFADVDWGSVASRAIEAPPLLSPDDGPLLASGLLSEHHAFEAGSSLDEEEDEHPDFTYSSANFPPPIEHSRPSTRRNLLPTRQMLEERPLFPPSNTKQSSKGGYKSNETHPFRPVVYPTSSDTSAFTPNRVDVDDFTTRFSWGKSAYPSFHPPSTPREGSEEPTPQFHQDYTPPSPSPGSDCLSISTSTTTSSLSAFVTVDLGRTETAATSVWHPSFGLDSFSPPEVDKEEIEELKPQPPRERPKVSTWLKKTGKKIASFFKRK